MLTLAVIDAEILRLVSRWIVGLPTFVSSLVGTQPTDTRTVDTVQNQIKSGSILSLDSSGVFHNRIEELKRPSKKVSLKAEVISCVGKSLEQLHTILEFLYDRGLRAPVNRRQVVIFVQHLTMLNLIDRGESYLKWKFAHLASACFGQSVFVERPSWSHPEDRPDRLLGGSAAVFIRRFCFLGARRRQYGIQSSEAYDFGWNVSQLKKGMPPVSDRVKEQAVEKCILALSTDQTKPGSNDPAWAVSEPDSSLWDGEVLCEDTRFDIRVLIAQVERTVDETHPPGWYTSQSVQAASISGHCLSNRLSGGALGAIVESRSADPDRAEFLRVHAQEQLDQEVTVPGVGELDPNTTDESIIGLFTQCTRLECRMAEAVFDRFCHRCGWEPTDSGLVEVKNNVALQFSLYDSFQCDQTNPAARLNMVRPVGLKEPFKTRTITGGPEGKYYRCKYIQKSVHSKLRKLKNAALVGETISAERLNSILWTPKRGEFYVSGDYTSATDNLDPRLSEAIARRIGRNAGWNHEWIELFVESLIHHRIWAGRDIKNATTEEELLASSVQQRWGQLMGSPTSFPVLCIANLGLTRHALELRYRRVIRIRDSGVLINGDDVGFVTDATGYSLWERVTSAGGLTPSVGKNFVSDDFIVLNSAFFDITWVDGSRILTHRPYVNYGLLRCRTDNGTVIMDMEQALCPSSDPRTPGIGTLAADLIKGHPQEVQIELLKRFISSWKPTLNRFLPRGMSYFLPPFLGGLGLPIIGEFKSSSGRDRFSYAQGRMAAFLARDHEKAALLSSMSALGHSESTSVWNKASPVLREHLESVGYTWTQEVRPSGSAEGSLTGPVVASAYASLTGDDVKQSEMEEGESDKIRSERYLTWKRSFEQLFDLSSRTTYAPLTEPEIQAQRPWRKVYDDYVVVDYSPQVDLRISPHQLLIAPPQPRAVFVHDRTFDLEDGADV
nr:RNA-dependent RNA polymerase [Flumine botourmiavirus 3]